MKNNYLIDYSESIRRYAHDQRVSESIHPEDFIFHFLINNLCFSEKDLAVKYYFYDGQNSANNLNNLISNVCKINIQEIKLLEFASGFGCLTRHLHKIMPIQNVTCCDIHEKTINFLSESFNVKTILSQSNPENLPVIEKFNIVFALSFFSHLPKKTFGKWFEKLLSLVSDDGYLIFTTHGKVSHEKCFPLVTLDEEGFFFLNDSEQKDLDTSDYGMTISLPWYVLEQSKKYQNCSLYFFQSGYWWGHQDLFIFKKNNRGITEPKDFFK